MNSSPVTPENNSPPGSPESECFATARELRLLLEEEAEVLRRFAGGDLLRLTPRKESLVNELGWKLEALKSANGGSAAVSDPLKNLLSGIDELNRSNGNFIARSLAHWEDFQSIFIPPSYGPGRDGTRPSVHAPRGLAFSREI